MACSRNAFVNYFVIENLPSTISVEEVYRSFQLENFTRKRNIDLSLAVDRKGQSLGYAFLTLPRSCTTKFLKINGRNIKGQAIKISEEKENCHFQKRKKWVKTYKEKGIIQCQTRGPQTFIPVEENKKYTIDLCNQYDMYADLTHHKFSQLLDEVIKKSYYQGIKCIVIPGKDCHQDALDVISQYKHLTPNFRLYLSTGIGPSLACNYKGEAARIKSECTLEICTSIGPIGLDYRNHGNSRIPKFIQIKAFRKQVKLACKLRKPIYLTEHNAHEDFVKILMEYQEKLPKCAIVDFTGTLEELELYCDMGFYIMISGQITPHRYLLTTVITEALQTRMIPEEQILLASNAPKFPPARLVGVTNYRPCVSDAALQKVSCSNRSEPQFIFTTLELIAKFLGYNERIEIQAFGKQVAENAKSFLYKRRRVHRQDKKERNREMKKLPDWFLVICQILVSVLILLTEVLLKNLGILGQQNKYFYYIFLAIALVGIWFYHVFSFFRLK